MKGFYKIFEMCYRIGARSKDQRAKDLARMPIDEKSSVGENANA